MGKQDRQELSVIPPVLPKDELPRDEMTLEAAYEQHVKLIYQFIYSRVGNREDAEDLTSLVFVRAVPGLEITRSLVSIRSWLYQVARTAVADYWREHYKAPTVPLDFIEHIQHKKLTDKNIESQFVSHSVNNNNTDGAQNLSERDYKGLNYEGITHDENENVVANQRVEQILTNLKGNYQQILKLRFLRGYSIKEAATEMGISENNAKVLQYRALQKAAEMNNL